MMRSTASKTYSSWCRAMIDQDFLKQQWIEARERLAARGLLPSGQGALSVRCSGRATMWLGGGADTEPRLVSWDSADGAAEVHALVYRERDDVGAVAWSGGAFGVRLIHFGGALPQLFDEQARHIGAALVAVEPRAALRNALATVSNVFLVSGMPLCLGTTPRRLALNMELFEKCAKAYVLAAAAGGRVRTLPWWVRRIANGRLAKDERAAAEAFRRGELPAESKSY